MPQLRIIGGEWRGRKLTFPDLPDLRPTPNRVRETLFNWLQPVIAGARCLDLFAGSGALGFEAASRGADDVRLVDSDSKVVQQLQRQADELGASQVRVTRSDARAYLNICTAPFDIVFLDPPFADAGMAELCNALEAHAVVKPRGHVYFELNATAGAPDIPSTWQLIRSKRAGNVGYHLAIR